VTDSAAAPSSKSIVFVCWGNICRSPMAERIAERMAGDAGLDAQFTSAATSTDELGNPMDRQAARALESHGYRASHHRARRITRDEIRRADLVVAMEQIHIDRMRRLAPDAKNIVLMSSFDPALPPGTGIDDPWSGPDSGFDVTLHKLERAMPGLLDWIRQS